MTIIRKIAYNTIFAAGARIIAVSLSLVSLGFITRYLGKEGFGNYSLILAFLYIFNILADLGLYSLMTREISRPGADERKIASNIFTIRIFALLLFLELFLCNSCLFVTTYVTLTFPLLPSAWVLVILYFFFLSSFFNLDVSCLVIILMIT